MPKELHPADLICGAIIQSLSTYPDYQDFTNAIHKAWKETIKSLIQTAKLLRANGSNKEYLDDSPVYRTTPLFLAVEYEKPEIVSLLLEAGAGVNIPLPYAEIKWTPLHKCLNLEIAKILLKHGADKNRQDSDGRTPYDVVSFDLENYDVDAPPLIAFHPEKMEALKALLKPVE